MKITREYLIKLGCRVENGEYLLRTGATYITLRINSDMCYCQLPGLYIGEITLERLHTLYHGMTGNSLNKLLPHEDQVLHANFRQVGNYDSLS